jgi:hypothetical protein
VQSATETAAAAVAEAADVIPRVQDEGSALDAIRAVKAALESIADLSHATTETLRSLGAAGAPVSNAIDNFRFLISDVADQIDTLIAYEEFQPEPPEIGFPIGSGFPIQP